MKIPKIVRASQEHQVLHDELAALLKRHSGKLTSIEVLAVASNMVGKLIALQDQRTVTPEIALEIVIQNLQAGNQDVLDKLEKTEGKS
jgi:hypothetical protein